MKIGRGNGRNRVKLREKERNMLCKSERVRGGGLGFREREKKLVEKEIAIETHNSWLERERNMKRIEERASSQPGWN